MVSENWFNSIRYVLTKSMAKLVEEAAEVNRQDKVDHMNETGGPIGNAHGVNPERKRGWLWVMDTPTLAVFQPALSHLNEVAQANLERSLC